MKLQLSRYDYAAYAAFCAYANSSLVIPIVLVDIARSLHFPLEAGGMSQGGFLQIARGASMVIALILCGSIGAKIGKRKTMGLCMALMGGGIILSSLAPSFSWLLPSLLVAGFGEGICEGIATPFVHDLHKSNQAGYVSIAHSFWSIGICLCVLIAGALIAIGLNWRFIIGVVGLFALLTSLGFLWRESKGHEYPETRGASADSGVWEKSWKIVHSVRFWFYCLAMFVGAGAEFCLTFWSASFIRLHFNASAWLGGLGTAFLAMGMFLGRSCFGKFVPDKYQPHLLLCTSIAGIPVTLLMLVLHSDSFGSPILALCILYLILFLGGLCVAPYWPTLQVYGSQQLPYLDSTMLFIWFSSLGIPGCAFFTWIMGVIGDHCGLEKSLLMIPLNMAIYAIIIYLEAFVFPARKRIK